MIEYHDQDETLTDDEKWEWVRGHIRDMEAGQFFAEGGAPSDVNEVRADEIATDYLAHRFWRLREEWAFDLETYMFRNREEYGLTWVDLDIVDELEGGE